MILTPALASPALAASSRRPATGGFAEILTAWMRDPGSTSRSQLLDDCTGLLLAAGAAVGTLASPLGACAKASACGWIVGLDTAPGQGPGNRQDVFPALLAACRPGGGLLGKPGGDGSRSLGLVPPVADPLFLARPDLAHFHSRAALHEARDCA